MNHARIRPAITLAIASLALASTSVGAAPTPPPAAPIPVAAAAAPTSIYRFDIAISGLDPSAHPTPVTYTMILEEHARGELSTGANIPLATALGANAPVQRQDVGLKLHFAYSLRGGVVVLDGDVEMTSADPAAPASAATIHRERASGVVPITPGTPALFTSIHDISSRHLYEVTVSATRLQ